jgi:hypothetical protein
VDWGFPGRSSRAMESTVSHVVLAQSVFEMTSYAEHVYITSASLVNVVLCQALVCNMIERSLILVKGLLISFLPSFIGDEETMKNWRPERQVCHALPKISSRHDERDPG